MMSSARRGTLLCSRSLTAWLILVGILPTLVQPAIGAPPPNSKEQVKKAVITSVRRFFNHLANEQYIKAWKCLSKTTQVSIIEVITKHTDLTAKQLEYAFSRKPELLRSFWRKLTTASMAEQLRFANIRVVKLESNQAVISYRPPGSDPVFLRCYLENGSWKLGLIETFFPKGFPSLRSH